jgi:uncharacterized membrane protein YeiH
MEGEALVLVLDLVGVFAFALSGALGAVHKRLDAFGVVVVASVAALGGGVLRDLLLGDLPPAALEDWRYMVTSLAAALLALVYHPKVSRLRRELTVLDALGLAVFTVAGTSKALDFDVNPTAVPVLGVLTGVGGGLLRDLLLAEVAVVLRREIYALASLAGALVVLACAALGLEGVGVAIGAGALVAGLRITSVGLGWRAPRARGTPPTEELPVPGHDRERPAR